WHADLSRVPARLRSRVGRQSRRAEPVGAESVRKRRVTANNLLAVLKAALNRAWRSGRVPNDAAWRMVRPFPGVDSPVIRCLSAEECTRLVNACVVEFRPMVRAAILTGCRYSELGALRAADFHAGSGTLAVRLSKSGKARHVYLAEEAQRFFGDMTAGMRSGDLVFARANGRPWGKSHQHRLMQAACLAARIEPPISFHVLRHT